MIPNLIDALVSDFLKLGCIFGVVGVIIGSILTLLVVWILR